MGKGAKGPDKDPQRSEMRSRQPGPRARPSPLPRDLAVSLTPVNPQDLTHTKIHTGRRSEIISTDIPYVETHAPTYTQTSPSSPHRASSNSLMTACWVVKNAP